MRVPIALLATCLLLGGIRTTAHASGPQPEEPPPIVPAQVDHILGHWQRGQGEAIIEVSQHDGVYRGVIVWSERRPETVGIAVFRELRYDAEEGAWHGRAYSIKRKREVPIDIEVPKHDHLELTAHILFFKKRVDFERVADSTLAALQPKPGL
jgi:hypothetical protein